MLKFIHLSLKNSIFFKSSVGLFLRLLLIMGITWLLDIFSYIENQLHPGIQNPLYYISDFMNAMTGLLIFICFVLKPKVLKLMKRRYVQKFIFLLKYFYIKDFIFYYLIIIYIIIKLCLNLN